MKRLKLLVSIGLMAAFAVITPIGLVGCKTNQQTTAYKGAGVTQVTVEMAMTVWGQWVKAGKATVNQEIAVKAAYIKYQASMATVCNLGAIAAASSQTNSVGDTGLSAAMQQAVAGANQSITDLKTLITSFGVTL